jgi:predicted Zn finger-like uncharacterized protein
MMIVCPNCETSYDVSAASLGAEGRSVRCVRCQEVWFAAPGGAPEQPAAEAVDAVSVAAATARYQRSAPPAVEEPGSDSEDAWPEDESLSVDPNLAARAADRFARTFDDPAPLDAGAEAVGMEEAGEDAGALAPHDAPPLAPEADESAPLSIDAHAGGAHPEDIESFAARRARREMLKRGRRIGRPSLATVILSLIAVNGALLGWRSDVVRLMPQTASLFAAIGLPVNLRGIAFTDVTSTRETHEGVSVLLVQGTIANISRQPHEVPRIRFAMRNAAGGEIYTWTTLPGRRALAPGEAQPFQTRLASPPSDGHEVVVRFFNRRDAIGGVH